MVDYRYKGDAVLVKSFIKRFLVPFGFDESSNIEWAYTKQGDKDCDAFYTAAKELDFLA